MPQFTLFDSDGRQLRLRDIREPVVVLNFWAFWCDTWIAQLPQLRELASEQESLNFKLLAVSVDGLWSDQLEAVCGQQRLPFPTLIDRRGRLSKQLRLRRIPTVIVLDRERKLTYIHEGHPGNPAILNAVRENSGDAVAL
jgi:peroxiredoxin